MATPSGAHYNRVMVFGRLSKASFAVVRVIVLVLTAWQDGFLDALRTIGVIAYLIVAYVQWKRPVSKHARGARNGFVVWWAAIAVIGAIGVIFNRFVEITTVTGFRVVLYTFIPIIFVALGGLVYYLMYLYTGRKDTLRLVVAFYAIMTLLFIVFVEVQDPYFDSTIDPETGEAMGLQYADESPAWVGLLLSLGLLVPPFAAAVAYFALFFQTHDKTVRYRILMVSGGFILWMGFSLLGSLSRFATGVEEQSFTSQVTGQVLGLVAAVLVLLAYYPPGFLRRSLELRGLDAHTDDSAPVDLFLPGRKAQHALTPRH